MLGPWPGTIASKRHGNCQQLIATCLLGTSDALFLQSMFGRFANTFVYGVHEPPDVSIWSMCSCGVTSQGRQPSPCRNN